MFRKSLDNGVPQFLKGKPSDIKVKKGNGKQNDEKNHNNELKAMNVGDTFIIHFL